MRECLVYVCGVCVCAYMRGVYGVVWVCVCLPEYGVCMCECVHVCVVWCVSVSIVCSGVCVSVKGVGVHVVYSVCPYMYIGVYGVHVCGVCACVGGHMYMLVCVVCLVYVVSVCAGMGMVCACMGVCIWGCVWYGYIYDVGVCVM